MKTIFKKSGLLLCAVSFIAGSSCAQNNISNDSLQAFVKQKTDAAFSKNTVPGIFVLYSNQGKHAFYTTGYAQPEKKLPFDMQTFFEIGSITKTFTAYVLLNVLNQHTISDTSSILPYLPKEVQANKNLEGISFLNLMNHTAGLPRLPENMALVENDLQPYQQYDSKKLFDYLATAKPTAKGSYAYSNLGCGLAGVLAERISGKSYAALLDQYIFLPFKMVDKNNTIEKSDNKSQGYIADNEKSEYWNMNVLAPAGGLKCTGTEMLRYFTCMSKPINASSKAIIDSLTQPTLRLSPATSICRAWHTVERKNKPVVYWHNGGTYGFSTFGAFVKETGQFVLVIVNKFDTNNVSDMLGMTIINKMLE